MRVAFGVVLAVVLVGCPTTRHHTTPVDQPHASTTAPSTEPIPGDVDGSQRPLVTVVDCDDEDADGIELGRDRCPWEREIYNGFLDDDGCGSERVGAPRLEARRVGAVIHLEPDIEFLPESDVVSPRSSRVVDALASLLVRDARVRRLEVRLEGEAQLAAARAHELIEVLVQRYGVDRERLIPIARGGGGLARPRVELVVVEGEVCAPPSYRRCFPDGDGDGVGDPTDRCPRAAETFDAGDADGCPGDGDQGLSRQALHLRVGPRVVFDGDGLSATSDPAMDAVAAYLNHHPAITEIEIRTPPANGPTSAHHQESVAVQAASASACTAPADPDRESCALRSGSVRRALTRRGIHASRLTSTNECATPDSAGTTLDLFVTEEVTHCTPAPAFSQVP